MTLEQVLADAREDANRLRLHGHREQAESLSRLCDAVAKAAEDYLQWLSEAEACLRSGWSKKSILRRFHALEREGLARRKGRHREYRAIAIAADANLIMARHAGREAARQAS